MTDTTAFLNTCIAVCKVFSQNLEDLKSISDRIGADSALSTNTAAAATKAGRTELTAASFDNLKVCIDLIVSLLNAKNGDNISVVENTGGKVVLAIYEII